MIIGVTSPIVLGLSKEEAEDLLFIAKVYRDVINDESSYKKYEIEFNQKFNRAPKLHNFTEELEEILNAES